MQVKDFIKALTDWAEAHPSRPNAEVMLQYDGDTCIEFGRAAEADHPPSAHYLILFPNQKGVQFKMREVRMN